MGRAEPVDLLSFSAQVMFMAPASSLGTLLDQSAASLLSQLAAREISALDLMTATLDRIEALNPSVNALVGMADRGDLLAQARAKDAGPVQGPLHGLPIAVKDLVNVKGLVSTQGSPIFKDFVPGEDDALAARLRAAGAILIGKTNVPEFGLGSHTFNPVYGRTNNPFNPDRTCGGSSGGAGVALALGMVALADGSDMMGSLRNPAAWSNVYGFRPSWGRVPAEPSQDRTLHQLATSGPMARSPADIALLLDVMSHADPLRPDAIPPQPTAPLAPQSLHGMRLGWLADWSGGFPLEAGILEHSEAALQVLRDQGATVETLPAPFDFEDIWESWITLRSWQVGAALVALRDNAELMKDSVLWELERAARMTALDVHNASAKRARWFARAVDLFEHYDALILPTTQVWPFDINQPWPTEIAGVEMDTYHRWMACVVPVSLIGLPSLNMPAGFGSNGLPLGIQMFGAKGTDQKILAMGEAYHQATYWPQKYPPHLQ
jgi:amidase